MTKKSFFLLYRVEHPGGLHTGRLLHRWISLPFVEICAWGYSREEVDAKLELELRALAQEDHLPFRFTELPKLQELRVDIHLLTRLGKTRLVGERTAPLRLSYGMAAAEAGFLLVVPRFDWVLEVEKAELGATLVREQLAAFLAGIEGERLLDLLIAGAESLEAFRPGHGDPEPPPGDELERYFPETCKIAENWTARARRGLEAPIIDLFRIEQHTSLWQREEPCSLLLVGPAGVGKTSWVRLLAKRLGSGDNEEPRVLWASSAEQLLAGMSYLGQWEERCLRIQDELEYEGHYLYLGRLLALVEKRGHSSILALFAEALEEGKISLVAEATEEELERCRRLAPTIVRAFRQIRLEAPNAHEMPGLVARYLERRTLPQLTTGGMATLCHLLDAYQRQSSFPGKAFLFLDRWREELREKKAGPAGEAQPAGPREVTERFCKVTGLPAELIAPREATSLAALEGRLSRGVVGQKEACAAVARVLARFRGGVYDPDKPLGTLLFVGPTGVGKTELAKELARTLFGDEKRLLRFDMSEYHLPGAARRLLGVGRGLRSLAQWVREEPLSVLLFDEIEKAHSEVFDLLLGALGEGRLTDEEGGHVDLRMTIVILTSNLGVRRGGSPGFGDPAAKAADYHAAIRQFFRPELVNRFDEIVPFRALSREDIEKVVDLQIARIRQRPGFRRQGLRLHLEPDARTFLARRGFDPRYGARPLLRLIEAKVIAPLAALLAENPKTRKRQIYITAKAVPAPDAESLVLALDA